MFFALADEKFIVYCFDQPVAAAWRDKNHSGTSNE